MLIIIGIYLPYISIFLTARSCQKNKALTGDVNQGGNSLNHRGATKKKKGRRKSLVKMHRKYHNFIVHGYMQTYNIFIQYIRLVKHKTLP